MRPDRVLVDGKWDFVGGGITQRIVRGDARCLSISAASILAKVTRDRIMRAEAEHHPWWWFDPNKGYPCPRHQAALRGMGRRPSTAGAGSSWTGCRGRACPASSGPDPQGSLFEL